MISLAASVRALIVILSTSGFLPVTRYEPSESCFSSAPALDSAPTQLDRMKRQRASLVPLAQLGLPCGQLRPPAPRGAWPASAPVRPACSAASSLVAFPVDQRLADQRHFALDFVAVVEEREQPVVLVVRDRVVLVRVALGTADRQPQPDAAGGGHAIEDRLDAKLLLVGAPFGVGERLAVKGRGQPLARRRARQQVAGQLLDREAIERHVGVDRVDHPIAIPPGVGPRVVLLIAVGVGIAGQVEPVPAPAFAEVRRVQQPLDQLLVGVRRRVGHERVDLAGSGGRPTRSYDSRLMSVRGRPRATARSPCRSSRASTNRSIGLRGQSRLLTAGSAGRAIG